MKTLTYSLNPAIARQMWELVGLDENDRILDPCCGAGTILIERQLLKPALCIGIDIDPRALNLAKENTTEAKVEVSFKHGDIMEQKFSDGYFTKIISNLPYGIHSGSREKNIELYRFLAEASERWLKVGGKVAFITTAKSILWNAFAEKSKLKFISETPVHVRGLTPSIYIYERIS